MKAKFDSAEDQSVATINRRFLLMAGYSDMEIEEFGNVAPPERYVEDFIQKKSQPSKSAPGGCD